MVRICGGNDRHPWAQPVETAVELIGFNHDIVGVGEDIICAVVLGDASEEGIAVEVALVHDMSTHGGCCRLTVGSSDT